MSEIKTEIKDGFRYSYLNGQVLIGPVKPPLKARKEIAKYLVELALNGRKEKRDGDVS